MSATRNSQNPISALYPRGGSGTTWVELRAEIMARICDGTYPYGQLIPPEKDLANEFGCARATVNRALASLAQRGVLDRRRRVGTRVMLDVSRRDDGWRIPTARELIEKAGKHFSLAPLGTHDVETPSDVADRLFSSQTDAIIETRTILYAGDELCCVEIRWHDSEILPGLLHAMNEGALATEWIPANAQVSHLEHHLSARTAGDVGTADILNCKPTEPVLIYETCLWIGKGPASFARYVMRPGAAIPVQLR